MEEDIYTEVTEQSWFGRLKDALIGIFVGLLLIVVSIGVLFWNEGRAVKRYKALKTGSSTVVSVPADTVSPENEGRLVHVTGLATTEEILSDPDFPVSANALVLKRSVEMYQWEEYTKSRTEKKVGGGERTIKEYHYRKKWSSSVIRSSGFKKRTGHENPSHIPFNSTSQKAGKVTLGAFILSGSQVDDIDAFETVVPESTDEMPYTGGREVYIHDGGYYMGRSPGNPHIGDVRIHFRQVRPTTISIVARQAGAMFQPYMTDTGSVQLLNTGSVSASEMFSQAQSRNTVLTWIVRIGGLIAMFIGFSLLFRPLSVFGDVIPFIGNMIEFGTGIVAFILALSISITVIAIAWLFYRPLLGGGLIAASGALYFVVFRAGWGKTKKTSDNASRSGTKLNESGRTDTSKDDQVSGDPFVTESAISDPFLTDEDTVSMSDTEQEEYSEESMMEKGKALFAKEDYSGAISIFTLIIRKNNTNETAFYNRAISHSKTGNKEAFIADLKEAARNGHEKAAQFLKSKNIS